MRVETYSDNHFLDVVRLVKMFHEEAVREYDQAPFSPEATVEAIERLKGENAQNTFLLIVDGQCRGILAGVRSICPATGSLVFQELMWYVEPSFRSRGVYLLDKAQEHLKSSGFKVMIMAVLENSKTEKIKKLYERLGFKPMEVHYMRAI